MKAKEGVLYAMIQDDEVVQIFDSTQLREWDENAIFAVEIPQGKEILIGQRYDKKTQSFVEKSLDELKEDLKAQISFYFEREVSYMQAGITQGEIATYESQKREAQEYLADNNTPTPLLSEIAKKRGMSVANLAAKIIAKNEAYVSNLGKLLGYKQSLCKQVELAESKEALKGIIYKSPLA